MTPSPADRLACLLIGHKYRDRIRYERHGVMLISRYKVTQCARCGRIITQREPDAREDPYGLEASA
jgi:hypothetical protein